MSRSTDAVGGLIFPGGKSSGLFPPHAPRTHATRREMMRNVLSRMWAIAPVTIALMLPRLGVAATIIESGTGINAAAITPARDAFRVDLGGGTVAGANGSFGGVRREINWDGVPDASSAPSNLPADFFNVTSPRGVVFSTPGTG